MALARAKAENKPLFIDFTGYACVNCRKMEEHVWPEEGIINLLDEEYIVVSLYVDDKKELPKELQEIIVSQKTGKTKNIESYGDKWSAFQIETYEVNSQPYYALVSPDEFLLNTPVPYTPDADQYRSWLECGIDAWNKTK
jgi:thioredoxin-related protein